MNALLISLASLILFFMLVASLPFFYAGWRRATDRGAELQIWPVMRRLGVSADATPRNDGTMAHAIRRCVLCPSLEECEHWLESAKTDGIDEFCPNAAVIEGLRKR
ncbi:MAG TPA: DUF6455 family protein [Burkholderiales bacterium]|nr:DUF6455 family protein [Burkholderiales bacterium]